MKSTMRILCLLAAAGSFASAAFGEGAWFVAGKLLVSVAWLVLVAGWGQAKPWVGAAWVVIFAYNSIRWAHTTVVADSWWALAFLLFWSLGGCVVVTLGVTNYALHRELRQQQAAAAQRRVWERGTYEW